MAQLGVGQDVEGGELLGVDTLKAEDLDGGAGEAALRGLGGALHEEDNGGGADGVLDRLLRLVGEEPVLGEEGDGSAEGQRASGGAGCLPHETLRCRVSASWFFAVVSMGLDVRESKLTERANDLTNMLRCVVVRLAGWSTGSD